VRDVRSRPIDPVPFGSFDPRFRDYQRHCFDALVRADALGVIDACPRSGKTLLALALCDVYACPTLYLAPSLAIVRQTYRRMVEVFGEDCVARVDGEASERERDLTKTFVVATPDSAVKLPKEWYAGRELLIVDEFHHSAAERYYTINSLAERVYHRVGLTGTYFRTAGDDLAMHAICSGTIAQVTAQDLISAGWLVAPVAKAIRVPGRIYADNFAELHRTGIAEYEPRNELICRLVEILRAAGSQILVITNRRQHAQELGRRTGGTVVMGGNAALMDRALDEFRTGRIDTLIGTSVIGEGVDVPNATALIHAAGGSASVSNAQTYFRPLTSIEGKASARVYDFWDQHHDLLCRHSQARLGMLSDLIGAERVEVL
jgi:superfamily II DNA or RNA helicase